MGKICMDCGQIIHKESTECQYCNSKNVSELNSNATMGDFIILRKISKDANFIKSMMELHDTDIIEYTAKMSQFKQQVGENNNIPKCPTCGSTKLSKVSVTSKAGSVFMFGLLSQKVKKTWHCDNCGYEW